MKLSTATGVLVLAASLFLTLSCAPSESRTPTTLTPPAALPKAGPRIFFEEDSVDRGKVLVGTQLGYSFRFKNTGDEPLVISGASALALEGY